MEEKNMYAMAHRTRHGRNNNRSGPLLITRSSSLVRVGNSRFVCFLLLVCTLELSVVLPQVQLVDAQAACTNATNCNSRAANVSGTTPNCTCTCLPAYDGDTCNACAFGYSGYPNCFDECTSVDVSCNGHANYVLGDVAGCVCSCFTGYTGTACDGCASGYIGYPNCVVDTCTSTAISCFGNANSLTLLPNGTCQCNCKAGYGGPRCSECATGFTGYPACVDACTSPTVSCNNHGISVTGSPGSCSCVCESNYTGSTCQTCAGGYDTLNGNCVEACTDPSVSCEAHAYGFFSGSTTLPCVCNCYPTYTGDRCDQCDTGYYYYPHCDPDDCTSVWGSCYGNAVSLQIISMQCVCSCKTNFSGTRCNSCAAGYTGYPACFEDCTDVAVSCSGKAYSVMQGPGNTCICECMRGFTGPRCNQCLEGFGPSFPNCVDQCTNKTSSCYNAALAVSGTSPNCVCTCRPGYRGSRCQFCDVGYRAYPLCFEDCTSVSVSCSGHAVSVSVSPTDSSKCLCVCSVGWGGEQCDACLPGYAGANCDTCTVGYIVYNDECKETCLDSAASCNNHGSVMGSFGNCSCVCYPGYGGARCDTCAVGFAGYPACVADTCTDVSVSCNDHATGVSGTPPNCVCQCLSLYAGTRCGACAVGYTNYPSCTATCSVNTSCSGHAQSVSGTYPSCTCVCLTGFSGAQCNACAPGYTGYPSCVDECTSVEVSCNGKAAFVSGLPGYCVCTCFAGFAGYKCGECASGYRHWPYCEVDDCTSTFISCDARATAVVGTPGSCECDCYRQYNGTRCDACAVGYLPPTCVDSCSIVNVSCSGHGTSFAMQSPSCICNCLPAYRGAKCDLCNVGYSGYPNCTEDCTDVGTSCNGNAVTVSNISNTCVCACKLGYAGTRCEACNSGYAGYPNCAIHDCSNVYGSCNGHAYDVNGSLPNCNCYCLAGYTGSTCSACATGFVGYPSCADNCSDITVSCSGKAHSVTRDANGACICECMRGFTGPRCNQCLEGFGPSFPNCVDQCTNKTSSCYNAALAVSGTSPNCVCTCRPGYRGSRCQFCDVGYSGYPECYEDCTSIAVSCSGRATAVVWNRPTCNCTCIAGWGGGHCAECAVGWAGALCDACAQGFTGTLCSQCTVGYDSATQCSTCLTGFTPPLCSSCEPGYDGYPICVEMCNNAVVSCNGHGIVIGDPGRCTCTCNTGYAGVRCDTCANQYAGYPSCIINTCTDIAVSCNNHASAVSGLAPPCTCSCLAGYAGFMCESCATGYNNYPNCTDACTNPDVSCNGHGTAVAGTPPSCSCTCKKGYEGVRCDSCSLGHFDYPTCYDECSNLVGSCGEHALRLEGTVGNCSCVCKTGYAGATCAECTAGYIGYPNCVPDDCTNYLASCNNHGTDVAGSPGSCFCTCEARWSGLRCEKCAPGYANYPDCTDDCTSVLVSCNGKASHVSGLAPDCACYCLDGYTGLRCNQCAVGYTGYPVCLDACTSPYISCSGNGYDVAGEPGNCTCQCKTGYTGAICDRCGTGYGGYPNCAVDDCTNVYGSCNGKASAVSGSFPNCTCSCFAEYAGTACEMCAAGYTGYPTCVDACTNVAVSCNNHAVTVQKIGSQCVCTCQYGYDGTRCNYCKPGFIGYPTCIDTCTNPDSSCNGHGLS